MSQDERGFVGLDMRVLVVDDDRPANAVSQGVGGLPTHDRVKPADLRRSGRRQLEAHGS
jgi:hypothetical protein